MARRYVFPHLRMKPVPAIYTRLLEVDAVLVAKGFPAMSEWWKDTLKRFYESGKRQCVLRVGRRGGKSSTLCRVAVTEALYGEHTIPPGDVGIVGFVSVRREEAVARLRTIKAILDALGVAYEERGDTIEVPGRRVVFQVFTASVSGVVGGTWICGIGDEVAAWKDVDRLANPAKAIFAQIRPTMASMPNAKLFVSSTPLSEVDYHAKLFDAGETDHQCVAWAPTWVAHPAITEAETRADEPDERASTHSYAAKPVASVTQLIGAAEFDALVRKGERRLPPIANTQHAILLDVGLRNDRTAILAVRRELREDVGGAVRDVIVVCAIVHLMPRLLRPISVEMVVEEVTALARVYPGTVYADLHYYDAIAPRLRERRVVVADAVQMSPTAISGRVTALQARVSQGGLEVIEHEELRKEILNAQLVMHAGGRQTLRAKEGRGHHDDLVAALLLGVDHEIGGRLRPCDADVIVEYEPVQWTGEPRHLSGGRGRYFKRLPTGERVERPPPRHTLDWDEWAEEMVERGMRDAAGEIDRWLAERGRTSNASSDGLSIPVALDD